MARKAITALLVTLTAVVAVALVLAVTNQPVTGVEFWAFVAVAVAVGWASRSRGLRRSATTKFVGVGIAFILIGVALDSLGVHDPISRTVFLAMMVLSMGYVAGRRYGWRWIGRRPK